MVRELVYTLKALLNEGHRPLTYWMTIVPVMQWARKVSYRERYQACPCPIIVGHEPTTTGAMLVEEEADEWTGEILEPERVPLLVGEVAYAQGQLHRAVLERVRANRARTGTSTRKKSLPKFVVVGCEMLAKSHTRGQLLELLSTLAGDIR